MTERLCDAGGGQEPISDFRIAELPSRALKLIRIKNRVYGFGERTYWSKEDGAHLPAREVKSHAEYAVIDDKQRIFARIKRVGYCRWVALERADEKKFGLPVSPLNLTSFKAVKTWAMERYGKNGK